MSAACQLFRQRWLDGFALEGDRVGPAVEGKERHCDACADCAAWHRRIELQIGALRTLERLLAPAPLEDLVAEDLERTAERLAEGELAPAERRVIEAVRSLTPRPAPAQLDALVAAGLAEAAAEAPSVRAVRGLSPRPAPAVLDRLVDERLRDPARAQAEGWVGTLERKAAPRTLEVSVERRLLGAFQRRLVAGPRGWGRVAAAAAVLALLGAAWGLRDRGTSATVPGNAPERVAAALRPFEVVGTDEAHPLDPLTRSLRDLLTPAASIDEYAEPPLELLPEELRGQPAGRREPLGVSRPGDSAPSSAAGSSGTGTASAGSAGSGATGSARPPFGLVAENPLDSIAHQGLRQITFFDGIGGLLQFVAYEEVITTDGQGRFEVQPTQVLTPVQPDPLTFQFLMENRQGFIYRYRDFAVRDAAAFQRNYLVARRPQGATLLGRPVEITDVTRRDGMIRFEVWTDVETGLVLSYVTRDASGTPLVWMKYKSLDLSPDLSGVSFHQPLNAEQPLTLGRPLKPQTGGQVPSRPKLLPPGYALLEMATVADPDTGQRWIKSTYSDGVLPLFFLELVRRPTPGATAPPRRLRRGREGDRVLIDELGGVASAHARIGSDEFIAVGYVSITELLDLVQSAL